MPADAINDIEIYRQNMDPSIIEIDNGLNGIVGNIDILNAVKPINYLEQKQLFFTKNYSFEPSFDYKKNNTNPFSLKRALYNLPLENLKDGDFYILYKEIIDAYVDKIDQFVSIGSERFLYNSLRYYGEPEEKDMRNARFILHLPEHETESSEILLDAKDIKAELVTMAETEGYTCEIIYDDAMIANALVSGTVVKINSRAKMTPTDVNALAHHELGVHLVTSLNSKSQPLRLLSVGCPINTTTQEGLAILSELLSGNLTIKRLKVLALRVLAVKSMIDDRSFRKTFLLLKESHNVDEELAFTITARVYRGGGFTKDHLYLKGLRLILNAYENEDNFNHLLAGKTSLPFLPNITRLIEKQYLLPPKFITPAFKTPMTNDAVHTLIIKAIR